MRSADPTLSDSTELGNPLYTMLALAGLALVCMMIFIVSIGVGVRGDEMWMIALSLLTAFFAMTPLCLDMGRAPAQRQLLISFLGMAFVVFFSAPVFTQYFLVEGPVIERMHLVAIGPADVLKGQMAALLGLVAMLLGYALPLGKMTAAALPRPDREWSLSAGLGVALFMIPVGWFIFLSGQLGIIPKRLGSGVLGNLASWYYYGIALLMVVWHRYRAPSAIALMLVFLPAAMAFSFFTGSKTLLLAPLAMIGLAHIVVTRKIRYRWLIGGLALLVILYPISHFYREVLQAGNRLTAFEVLSNPIRVATLLGSFLASSDPLSYLTTGIQATGDRLNALHVLSVIVRETPERVPYQGGWSIGYIALGYIPRVVWPSKPILTIGQWVTDTYVAVPGLIRSNTGPSWIGELYFNFGHLGIFFGMAIMGVYFRFVQSFLLRPNATIPLLFIGTIVLFQTARSLGGGLMAPTNGVVLSVVPIVMLHFVVRTLTRPPRATASGGSEPPAAPALPL